MIGGGSLNIELASIMAYVYSIYSCKIYEDEIPEQFEMPSIYYPPPTVIDGNDTNMTYLKTYTVNVKLFHHKLKVANKKVELIADSIRGNRMMIPMIDEEGNKTGDFIRVSSIETRLSDHFAVMIFTWSSRYYYERENVVPLEDILIDSEVKE